MIIEGSFNDNWPRCSYRPIYPSYEDPCGAIAAFACDWCSGAVCMLHVRITDVPAGHELCGPCRDRKRALEPAEATRAAADVVRQLEALGTARRERRRGRVRSWLAGLLGRGGAST